MLEAAWQRNDRLAHIVIIGTSVIVFLAIVLLSRVELDVKLKFNRHIFAEINAVINSTVSFLLLFGLISVRRGRWLVHKRLMIAAIFLSALFLISYICHHLLAGETKYGDSNLDGLVSEIEKEAAGSMRLVYFGILASHILLAAIILPFILYTAYRSMTGDWERHRKLARITWPIWFYVAISGVVVYLMISPFYR